MTTTTHVPSTSSLIEREKPEPVTTGNLYGRVTTYGRLSPGILCLVTSILGLLYAENGSLFFIFGTSTAASGYLIYLSHSYRHLQTLAESNEKLKQSITQLNKKFQESITQLKEQNQKLQGQLSELDTQNTQLKASVSEFEELLKKNKKVTKEQKKQVKTLKEQIEALEAAKRTISEEAAKLVEKLKGLQTASQEVLSAAEADHKEFGTKVGLFSACLKELETLQSTSKTTLHDQTEALVTALSTLKETFTKITEWKNCKQKISEGISTMQTQQQVAREIQAQTRREQETLGKITEKSRQEQKKLATIRQQLATETGKLTEAIETLTEYKKLQTELEQQVTTLAQENSKLAETAKIIEQKITPNG